MNLRLFIYVSIFIHIIGGAAIFLHYRPFNKAPEVVSSFEEELNLEEKNLSFQKPKKQKLFQAKKIKKKPTKKPVSKNLPAKSSLTKMEPSFIKIPVPKAALPEAPLSGAIKDLQDVSPLSQPEPPVIKVSEEDKEVQQVAKTPEEIEDMEEVEEEEAPKEKVSKTPPPKLEPEVTEAQKVAKTLKEMEMEAMEEIEEEEKGVGESAQDKNKSKVKNFFDLKQKRGNPEITYPEFARKKGLQGKIIIRYYVTKEGLVDQISLRQSSGHSEMDNYVLRLLARYEFLPNQETWIEHEVNFVLKGKEKERLQLRKKDDPSKN